MQEQINFLTNNYYKVLEKMVENSIMVDGLIYCPLTQDELAKKTNISRNTIITIIKKLNENGFLIHIENSKRYALSDMAMNIVKKMKKI